MIDSRIYVNMDRISIIQNYITQIWAVSPRLAAAGKYQLASIIKGEGAGFSDLKEIRKDLKQRTDMLIASPKNAAYEIDAFSDSNGRSNIPLGSTAILRVDGVIQKSSDACTKGIDSYIQELEIAGAHPNVESVLIEVHSGGGSAFGPEDFSNVVAEFEKKYNKPIAALIKNEAASAAYMMIARSPKIFISGQSALAGSIGTMITLYDDEKELESLGIKEIVLRASDSFNKNEEFYQALQGNSKPMIENILNPLNKSFQDIVRKGRRGKLDLKTKTDGVPDVLTGKVYIGQDIIDAGLADAVADRYQAMKWLSNKAKQMKSNSNKSKSIKQMFEFENLSQEDLIAKVESNKKSIDAIENKESEDFKALQQEQKLLEREVEFRELKQNAQDFESINSKVSELEDEIQQLSENNETLQSELNTKNVEIEQLSSKLSDSEDKDSKIDELESNLNLQKETNEKIQSQNIAYKKFISETYGEDKVKAVALANENGDQPESKKEVDKVLGTKERRIKNMVEIRKALFSKVRK